MHQKKVLFHFQILMSAAAMVGVLNFAIILKEATTVTVSKDLTWKQMEDHVFQVRLHMYTPNLKYNSIEIIYDLGKTNQNVSSNSMFTYYLHL